MRRVVHQVSRVHDFLHCRRRVICTTIYFYRLVYCSHVEAGADAGHTCRVRLPTGAGAGQQQGEEEDTTLQDGWVSSDHDE